MKWFSRLSASARPQVAMVLLSLALPLLLTGCLGPKPIVAGVTQQPPTAPPLDQLDVQVDTEYPIE